MIIRGFNDLDRQLVLRPRDYAEDPHGFGRRPDLAFRTPPGGNDVSRRAAQMQHEIVVAWQRRSDRSGAAAARRWGFSRQTWSKTALGQRWGGMLVLCAMLEDLR